MSAASGPEELIAAAEASRAAGDWQRAIRLTEQALEQARAADRTATVARAALSLSEAFRQTDQLAQAREMLELARGATARHPEGGLLAMQHLVEANLAATGPASGEARALYAKALEAAEQSGQPVLAAKAGLALLALGDQSALARAQTAIERVPEPARQLELRLALADGRARGLELQPLLLRVLDDAQRLQEPRLQSEALGRLGALAERSGDLAAALDYTRRASFFSQGFADLQFRWYWQLGRLHDRQHALDSAIRAWRLSLESLQLARSANHAPIERAELNAMLYGFADLLLRRAARDGDDGQRRAWLLEARESVERLKAGELRDLFRDDCVTELQSRITPIDQLPAGSAAIYPVMLEDRLELLVSLPGDLRQVIVPVSRSRLVETIQSLRRSMEKRTTREWLPPARQLFDWLIAPIEPLLRDAGTHTLVIVPDGALRTIPLSSLHDGSRFLVQRFALATTPGLQLTDARPLGRTSLRLMLAGVSKPVQGFGALSEVPAELGAIRALYGGTQLLDESFRVPAFGQALEQHPYSIVHVASHAQFDADPSKTFLLAFDEKIGLDRLSELMSVGQYRREPIELITLSACQTATGDERAALGLAGIAIKAGARSALAGLWYVDDRVSSQLLVDFYRALREPGLSKAQALQRAQLRMIGDRRFAHPGYWAPYLMIGNWQ